MSLKNFWQWDWNTIETDGLVFVYLRYELTSAEVIGERNIESRKMPSRKC